MIAHITMIKALFIFTLSFISQWQTFKAENSPCYALRLHRDTPTHLTLSQKASKHILTQGNEWTINLAVKFLEGRPGAIISPMLDLVDTPLGMRLRVCGHLKSGWTCMTAKRLWYDDGEWHQLSVTSDGSSVSLLFDGTSVGLHGGLDHQLRVGNKVMVGYDGNTDLISSSLLIKKLHVSKTGSDYKRKTGLCSTDSELNGWFWELDGSIRSQSKTGQHDLSVRFNDLSMDNPKEVSFALIDESNLNWIYNENMENLKEGKEFSRKSLSPESVVTEYDVLSNNRELVEIFTSKPTSTAGLPVLTVIYYSSDTNWDAYWELYHNWLVHVLLAEVRETREVRVVLDRCVEPCTLESIILVDHALVVLNAHCSPKLDPFDVAEEIDRRGLKHMSLFHANHEKPWVEDVSDWRNGYHGGYKGLAEAYGKWEVVLRQHHFEPLASLLGSGSEVTQVKHDGYLYVPLGPAYVILEQPFNQLGGVRSKSSSRNILCSFVGAQGQYGGTSDRTAMLQVLQEGSLPLDTCEVHLAAQPVKADAPAKQILKKQEYNRMLFNSKFALCPGGNSFETFRHWEALGTAAIPISASSVLNHSFAHLWCSNPSLVSDIALHHESSRTHKNKHHILLGRGRKDAEYWLEYVEATGCPLVLLPSWSDLPSFLSAFIPKGEDVKDIERISAMGRVLDSIQRKVLDRAEEIKVRTSKDINSLLMGQL